MIENLKLKFTLWLRLLVISTQSLPGLRGIYHFIYILTLKSFLKKLNKDFEIVSVYFKGSMARGNPCYGLSDIDLFILVKEDLLSGHGAVSFAKLVEESRKGFFFKIIGEIEVLTQKEWGILAQRSQVVYVELFQWKFFTGKRLDLLENNLNHLSHLHKLQFACFQYLLYVNSITFQEDFLGRLKRKRLHHKLTNFLWGSRKEGSEFITRFEAELASFELSGFQEEVLKLRGFYPFLLCSTYTCAFVGNHQVREIEADNLLVFARAEVGKIIKNFVFTFMSEHSQDQVQQAIYYETLIFQKFGGIVNLYDKSLNGITALPMITGIQEALTDLPIDEELRSLGLEFCQNVLRDLRKLT
jgi:predicted nucleotidyltransferase